MFDTNLLITVIYLLAATIVRHGYAAKPEYQQRCENLMQGFWFEYESDGKTNFQKAFFNLTSALINAYFDQRYEAIVPMNPRRGVVLQAQEKLLKDYISNLYSNHGLNLEVTLLKMGKWCTDKIAEVDAKSAIKNSKRHCKKVIRKKFEFDSYVPKWVIYKQMYERFTLNYLRTIRNEGDEYGPMEPSRSVNVENSEELVNNYPYFYFRYHEETIRVQGSFNSIEQYCSRGLSQDIIDQLMALPPYYYTI